MVENKQILTLKDLSENKTLTKGCAMIFSPIILIIIIWLIYNGDYDKLILPLVFIIIMIINIIKEKKEKKIIDKKNFKIIEDKIYDKEKVHVSKHEEYYLYTKNYGKIEITNDEYLDARKDSFIYLIIGNTNNKVIDTYLTDKYELSHELISKFIPYDETLGEKNFDNRINDMINEMKEKNNKVKCKSCGKEYKTKNQDVCPSCHSIYQFDINDVVHQKDWYKKELK